jgi:hypothetical protein
MTSKFPSSLVLLAAAALVVVGATAASAQSKPRYDKDGRPYYGAAGPNQSYQQGPNTPVSMSRRAHGSTPAPKSCRVIANSKTTRSRRRMGTHHSRARTTTGQSIASRSARHPM